VRSVLKDCLSCKLRNKAPETQIMAPLPDFRLNTGGYAFETVGVDYFGPFNMKRGRGREKRWCCLFACLTIRAVHLEVAFSMDSDSFLCAFFRFVARRGVPRDVYSDNGTNCVGALDNFQRALEQWDQNKIHNKLLSKSSNWHFGPPEAHHPGGAWERIIRSVRQVLFYLMSEQTLTDEALLTFLAEAEKVPNDQPIVTAASDVDAFAALTPNDLILRRQSPSLVEASSLPRGYFLEKVHKWVPASSSSLLKVAPATTESSSGGLGFGGRRTREKEGSGTMVESSC
jgi:hypothetical protein